ncbi:MAG: hypothetical protein FJ026_06810 [Chloroflexi bacterium]|nr:hypothetical protein [Chloroflexota bacterium]
MTVVIVLWNLQEVFQEIGQEEPIAQLRAQVAAHPPEETVTERVAIGQIVQVSLQRRRAALQDRLLPPLQEKSLDMVVNALMDDSMVINVGLLVDKTSLEALDQRLQALDEEFAGRFRFRRVGPLPPYSFGTVEVQVPSFEAIDEARRYLDLGETVTPDEIKQAYRRLASCLHPDHNRETPGAEARVAELTQAYHLLSAYAESHRSTENTQQPCCYFDRQTVEQTLMIAIRRQEMVA